MPHGSQMQVPSDILDYSDLALEHVDAVRGRRLKEARPHQTSAAQARLRQSPW
jgi:hypothetical protein